MRGLHGQRRRAAARLANVYRMKLLGATVVPVESGSRTLKDALNEAMRDWVTNIENTFYIIGTVAGPDPYPRMVRDFQTVIGNECLFRRWPVPGTRPTLPHPGTSSNRNRYQPATEFATCKLRRRA